MISVNSDNRPVFAFAFNVMLRRSLNTMDVQQMDV